MATGKCEMRNAGAFGMGERKMGNGEGKACHAKWEMLRIRPEAQVPGSLRECVRFMTLPIYEIS